MKRILLIEDDQTLRLSLARGLCLKGYEVRTLENGRGAVDLCQAQLPDVVIADIWMPERSGIELLLELRMRWPGMKIILISGVPDAKQLLGASQALGADITLAKPFDMNELFQAVQAVLATRDARSEASGE